MIDRAVRETAPDRQKGDVVRHRKRLLAAIVALAAIIVVVFAGCGGGQRPARTVTIEKQLAPFVCHHRDPGQMGECVRQELEYDGVKPAAPRLGALPFARGRAQGVDISRWQPHPDFRALRRQGIRFVIIQDADNDHLSNPFFDSQVRAAHAAGLKVGVYIFAEGASASSQAAAVVAGVRNVRSLITLGAAVDAEVGPAYSQTCSIARDLRAHFHFVLVYGSPGTYAGGSCGTLVWPAEWGGGRAYPLPGFPSSAIRVRQWCGTCFLSGNAGQIDRDEDLGLLREAAVRPVPPLRVLYRERESLRRLLLQYGCRRRVSQHQKLGPRCHAWFRAGALVNRQIRAKGGR